MTAVDVPNVEEGPDERRWAAIIDGVPPVRAAKRNGHRSAMPPSGPMDVDRERAALAAMMLSADSVDLALSIVSGRDFGQMSRALIFDAIVASRIDVGRPDAVLVLDRLRAGGHHDAKAELVAVMGHTPSSAAVERLCGSVRRDAGARRLLARLADAREQVGAGVEPAEVLATLVDEAAEPAASTWRPMDLAPAVLDEAAPIEATVLTRSDGAALLYPGSVNGVHGEGESCKSWLCAIAAADELRAGGVVWWIDLEDNERTLIERLRALTVPDQALVDRLRYVRPTDTLTKADGATVARAVDADRPAVAVFDSVSELMALHGLDPNVAVDVVQMHRIARRFLTPETAVVLIDHVTKATDTRGRFAVGSERKLSGIDGAAYAVEALTTFGLGRTAQLRITVAKDRPGRVRQHCPDGKTIAEVTLNSYIEDGGVTWRIEPPIAAEHTTAFRPTVLMERVSQALEAHPGGLSKNAIRGAVTGKAVNVDLAIETLIGERFVTVQRGPRNTSVHISTAPFRRDDQAAHHHEEP